MEEINFICLKEEECFNKLKTMVYSNIAESNENLSRVYPAIKKELEYIKQNKWAKDFLVALSLSQIAMGNTYYEHFFYGRATSSLVAYYLGITDEQINPIDSGLIFESAIQFDLTTSLMFGYYVGKNNIDDFLASVKKAMPQIDVTTKEQTASSYYKDKIILECGKMSFIIYTSLEEIQEQHHYINEKVKNLKLGLFKEDYLRLLCFIGGFSYEEANLFIRKCEINSVCEIEEFKIEFLSKANGSLVDKEKFFYDMVLDLSSTISRKDLYLNAKLILEEEKHENY